MMIDPTLGVPPSLRHPYDELTRFGIADRDASSTI